MGRVVWWNSAQGHIKPRKMKWKSMHPLQLMQNNVSLLENLVDFFVGFYNVHRESYQEISVIFFGTGPGPSVATKVIPRISVWSSMSLVPCNCRRCWKIENKVNWAFWISWCIAAAQWSIAYLKRTRVCKNAGFEDVFCPRAELGLWSPLSLGPEWLSKNLVKRHFAGHTW